MSSLLRIFLAPPANDQVSIDDTAQRWVNDMFMVHTQQPSQELVLSTWQGKSQKQAEKPSTTLFQSDIKVQIYRAKLMTGFSSSISRSLNAFLFPQGFRASE